MTPSPPEPTETARVSLHPCPACAGPTRVVLTRSGRSHGAACTFRQRRCHECRHLFSTQEVTTVHLSRLRRTAVLFAQLGQLFAVISEPTHTEEAA